MCESRRQTDKCRKEFRVPGEGCGWVAVSLCSWWIPLPQLLPLLLLLAGHRRNTLALPPEGTETRNVGTFKCIIEERGTRHVCSFSLTHSAVVTSTSSVCVCVVCVYVCASALQMRFAFCKLQSLLLLCSKRNKSKSNKHRQSAAQPQNTL